MYIYLFCSILFIFFFPQTPVSVLQSIRMHTTVTTVPCLLHLPGLCYFAYFRD